MKRIRRRHRRGVDPAEQVLAGEHVRQREVRPGELRAVEDGKDEDLAEGLVRGREEGHQVRDALLGWERGVQRCGVEGEEAG